MTTRIKTMFAAGAAALLGPWLMTVVLGVDYRVAGGVLAALTMTAALLALLTLSGAATLALDGHRAFAVGWGLATVVSAAALLVPGPLAVRIAVSLAAGPLVGLVVHVSHVRGRLADEAEAEQVRDAIRRLAVARCDALRERLRDLDQHCVV